MTIAIGKIVKSNTHIDYVCQVYNAGEVEPRPEPPDYSFGTFVAIDLDGEDPAAGCLVGVIYNTLLMNPDFGNLGPRLSPRHELEVFSPDYLVETATLVGIIALGWIDDSGACFQGVPALAATVNNRVTVLREEALREFHNDGTGGVSLRYLPVLLSQNNPLVPPLLITVVQRLETYFPAQRSRLELIRSNLAWKSIVQPAG